MNFNRYDYSNELIQFNNNYFSFDYDGFETFYSHSDNASVFEVRNNLFFGNDLSGFQEGRRIYWWYPSDTDFIYYFDVLTERTLSEFIGLKKDETGFVFGGFAEFFKCAFESNIEFEDSYIGEKCIPVKDKLSNMYTFIKIGNNMYYWFSETIKYILDFSNNIPTTALEHINKAIVATKGEFLNTLSGVLYGRAYNEKPKLVNEILDLAKIYIEYYYLIGPTDYDNVIETVIIKCIMSNKTKELQKFLDIPGYSILEKLEYHFMKHFHRAPTDLNPILNFDKAFYKYIVNEMYLYAENFPVKAIKRIKENRIFKNSIMFYGYISWELLIASLIFGKNFIKRVIRWEKKYDIQNAVHHLEILIHKIDSKEDVEKLIILINRFPDLDEEQYLNIANGFSGITNEELKIWTLPMIVRKAREYIHTGAIQDAKENLPKKFAKIINIALEGNLPFDPTMEQISKIEAHKGRYAINILQKTDPTGLVLGELTNCCQKVNGAGESCMVAGIILPCSGFMVIKKDGIIVGQAWIYWVANNHSNILVLDNIEMVSLPDNQKDAISNLLKTWCQNIVNKTCISDIHLGDHYNDLNNLSNHEVNPLDFVFPMALHDKFFKGSVMKNITNLEEYDSVLKSTIQKYGSICRCNDVKTYTDADKYRLYLAKNKEVLIHKNKNIINVKYEYAV